VNRRGFGCALCALAALAAMRAAGGQTSPEFVRPGHRPPPDTDEGGLWSVMDRAERDLRTSRFVVRDRALNAYLREVVCRLGRDHCPDLRLYVVRTPQFNASMAPNGMMQVWTGLLLRCVDEAQLAAILGHEMGHYLRRHSLERFRDARDKSNFGAFLSLGLAVAGAGIAGVIANLALLASTFAYSREQEHEADRIGLELMASAGYARIAAAEVWEQLIAELAAGTVERSQNVLLATHPDPEERLGALREAAARAGGAEERGIERYRAGLAGVREQIVRDELSLRQYGRSEVVFDRLLAQAPGDGLLWYGKGEVYRLRAESGDPARAMEAYARALETRAAPPDTHRSIVMVELKQGNKERAQAALDAYLRAKPEAPDAGALRMLLEQ